MDLIHIPDTNFLDELVTRFHSELNWRLDGLDLQEDSGVASAVGRFYDKPHDFQPKGIVVPGLGLVRASKTDAWSGLAYDDTQGTFDYRRFNLEVIGMGRAHSEVGVKQNSFYELPPVAVGESFDIDGVDRLLLARSAIVLRAVGVMLEQVDWQLNDSEIDELCQRLIQPFFLDLGPTIPFSAATEELSLN